MSLIQKLAEGKTEHVSGPKTRLSRAPLPIQIDSPPQTLETKTQLAANLRIGGLEVGG